MLAIFLFLLLLTAGSFSEKVCSYHDVLNYLNLTKDNELFSMTRPVKDHRHVTEVQVELYLYAILDVRETDQMFVPYVWIYMSWTNEHISWDIDEFCDIDSVTLPTEALWKPDISILEMTEKDKAPPSPYLTINFDGKVDVKNDQVLVSTCRMRVYKFPFDTQICNLSFQSVVHPVQQLKLKISNTSSSPAKWSREVMRTQYEWVFIDKKITKEFDELSERDKLIFTIIMKRRSVLYIVNFLLPVLFFLSLDMSSFLISDTGGEKLGFKITLLLAITVMQLILNEILPSSSDRIPLIAVYCMGAFTLMLLSLLETILVMYLIDKDSATQDKETGQSLSEHCSGKRGIACFHSCEGEEKKLTQSVAISDVSPGETEQLKGSCSQLLDESHDLEKVSEELKELLKALTLVLNGKKEDEKPGYWTRKTKDINKAFFICYVTAAAVFLVCMCFIWIYTE